MAAMKEVPLKCRSVGDLVGKNFFIPSYQRGYRWDANQVEALLNDLAEFEAANDAKKFYCLQPLVVVKRDAECEEWEVVDGQQRLTTIYLILKQVSPAQEPPFHIRYERHPESKDGLHGLLQSAAAGSPARGFAAPDIHFIKEADKVIRTWLDKHNVGKLSVLTNRDGACAKFIWYEVEQGPEAIRAFTRLNAGKIRLKDSELIRALFLKTKALDQDTRQLIALRWDQMERHLQDPEFWSFLTQKDEKADNRIELLFQWIAQQKEWPATKDREIFDCICEKLKSDIERKKLWQEVENVFGTLEEWFEDNNLFHLIGFLVEQGEPVSSLLNDAVTLGKKEFMQHLKKNIRKHVLCSDVSRDGLGIYLKGLEYGDPKIKALLLCLNLATLEADQTGTVRFSFQGYKKVDWDIEHIRATASREPQSMAELHAALEVISDYWKRVPPATDKPLLQDLEKVRAALEEKSEDQELLFQLYIRLRERMEGTRKLGANNGLMNLTLLDAGTNRGYGNCPFAVKRRWVLELDQQAKYLLPCTRNVFTKSYSQAPNYLLDWAPEDATDYLSVITSTLGRFFTDIWEDHS